MIWYCKCVKVIHKFAELICVSSVYSDRRILPTMPTLPNFGLYKVLYCIPGTYSVGNIELDNSGYVRGLALGMRGALYDTASPQVHG